MDDYVKNIYDLLSEQGYLYDYMGIGYKRSKGETFSFLSERSIALYPGDVRDFLLTGHIRNSRIFDSAVRIPQKHLGIRSHKDGRAVLIKGVK